MSTMIDISEMDADELRTLVLGIQQRLMIEASMREMDQIEISTLKAENAALKKVLADRIVGLLVHPTTRTRTAGEFLQENEGGPTGEEHSEATTVITGDKDKDKFQA